MERAEEYQVCTCTGKPVKVILVIKTECIIESDSNFTSVFYIMNIISVPFFSWGVPDVQLPLVHQDHRILR